MKLINIINKAGVALIALALLASCNKYLDKPPLTSFNDNSYWQSETELQLFCNGFYSQVNGAGTGTTSTIFSNVGTGSESDFYFPALSDDQAGGGTETNIFPATAGSTASTWSTPYIYIRLAELLLARINKVPGLSPAAKNHYTGFAYFWLAEEYYDLVRHYGDVPFVNKYLDQSQDSSVIWGLRVPRDQVMDSVLTYINYAAANLYPKNTADATQGLGSNTVNQDVANALKSRICLFEGTWAKYHESNNQRATQYFQACQTASEAVMNSSVGYKLAADYGTIYRTNHTAGAGMATGGEVLLFRKYGTGLLSNSVMANATINTNNSAGLTKDAVESFLLTDGNPISVQGGDPLYKGDTAIAFSIANTVLANRDKRLVETVWPNLALSGHTGNVNGTNPSFTGYAIQRFTPVTYAGPVATPAIDPSQNDFPIYWLSEILLNEAEALTELGTFTQSNADATVNKLRARVGVAALNVANLSVDTKRDADVPALLWEVRRERRVELMLTSFRYWDLRRWGKISYLDPAVKPDISVGVNLKGTGLSNANTNGYLNAKTPSRVVTIPKNYLDFVPTGQLNIYTNASITFPQNTGW